MSDACRASLKGEWCLMQSEHERCVMFDAERSWKVRLGCTVQVMVLSANVIVLYSQQNFACSWCSLFNGGVMWSRWTSSEQAVLHSSDPSAVQLHRFWPSAVELHLFWPLSSRTTLVPQTGRPRLRCCNQARGYQSSDTFCGSAFSEIRSDGRMAS